MTKLCFWARGRDTVTRHSKDQKTSEPQGQSTFKKKTKNTLQTNEFHIQWQVKTATTATIDSYRSLLHSNKC